MAGIVTFARIAISSLSALLPDSVLLRMPTQAVGNPHFLLRIVTFRHFCAICRFLRNPQNCLLRRFLPLSEASLPPGPGSRNRTKVQESPESPK